MLGTTINREGIREDIDNRDYTYSPDMSDSLIS